MKRRSSHRPSTPRDRSPADRSPPDDQAERLQKVLAAAGVGSRRECEQLIGEGRVEVDRHVVTELGTRVTVGQQEIRVDGEVIHQAKRLYYAVNKPPGVVSTNRDPAGRARVIDLVDTDQRLFTVGRLDRTSEGLIVVTNDGQLANRLTHPRYGVQKTYLVRVAGQPTPAELNKLRQGVHLAEGLAQVLSLTVKRRLQSSTELEMVLNEGRNREIRRILARIGHKVLTLKRTSVGSLRLGKLPVGAARKLTVEEVHGLERCVAGTRPPGDKPPGRKTAGRKPAGRKPAGRKPAGGKPAVDKPAGRTPAGRTPAGGKPAGDKRRKRSRPAGRKGS
jgi:23S rRNA pseudouridine2605 synthase